VRTAVLVLVPLQTRHGLPQGRKRPSRDRTSQPDLRVRHFSTASDSSGLYLFSTLELTGDFKAGAKRTSLPSTEKEGVKPGEHYDGVGPLPGSISETSVAKLPDERLESTAGESDKSAQRPLPSKETKGTRPREHYGGVGSLPGSNSETSVAKLPDEREAATSEERSGAAADVDKGPVQDTTCSPGLGIVNVGLNIEKTDPKADPTSVQKTPERDGDEADAKVSENRFA